MLCDRRGGRLTVGAATQVVTTLIVLVVGMRGMVVAEASPGEQQVTASAGTARGTPLNVPPCNELVDAGYSILLEGHTYSVRVSGSAGPSQTHLFFERNGSQVTDANLLSQLATAAWTRENVVVSADTRNGSRRVSGILETSQALEGYSSIQDVLAGGIVEALEARVTDSASLAKRVPNLTVTEVANQFRSAPKTLFMLIAQRGLEASLAAYKEMDAIPLPPADSTTLSGADLIRIKGAYVRARTLELPFEALVAELKPTREGRLPDQAFASAIDQTIPTVGLGGPQEVTLQSLLDFQMRLANLSETLPVLSGYAGYLKLALNRADATNNSIAAWAADAGDTDGELSITAGGSWPAQLVHPPSGQDGSQGFGIMRSVDGGSTWTKVVGDSGVIDSFAIDNNGHIFAGTGAYVGGDGIEPGLLQSSDDGLTWTRTTTCANGTDLRDLRSIVIGSNATVYAGGGGGFVRSTDGGHAWSAANDGLAEGRERSIQSVVVDRQARLLAGTYDGVVRFSNGQGKWVRLGLTGTQVTSLLVTSGGNIYAGTGGKGIFRSSDNGLSWQPMNGGLGAPWISGLAFGPNGNIYAAIQGGGITRSIDGGVTWKSVLSLGKNTEAYTVSATSDGEIFASAAVCCPVLSVGVFRSQDGGNTWTKMFDIDGDKAVGAVAVTQAGSILVGLSTVGE